MIIVINALPDFTMMSVNMRCLVSEVGLGKQFGHAQNTIHRGSDFVAHIGEEFAFCAIGRFSGNTGVGEFFARSCHFPVKDGRTQADKDQQESASRGNPQSQFLGPSDDGIWPDGIVIGHQHYVLCDCCRHRDCCPPDAEHHCRDKRPSDEKEACMRDHRTEIERIGENQHIGVGQETDGDFVGLYSKFQKNGNGAQDWRRKQTQNVVRPCGNLAGLDSRSAKKETR